MTEEQMERAIEFLLDHHAKFSADMDELKEVQRRQARNIDKLTADVQSLTENTISMQSQSDRIIAGMRDGFNKLILGNEISRDLAEQATRLAIAVSQRVTGPDQRVVDLESKQ